MKYKSLRSLTVLLVVPQFLIGSSVSMAEALPNPTEQAVAVDTTELDEEDELENEATEETESNTSVNEETQQSSVARTDQEESERQIQQPVGLAGEAAGDILPVGSQFTVGDFIYDVREGTNIATQEYIGTATDVVVPASVVYNGVTYNVTVIGDHSMSKYFHWNMPLLTSVSLPEGITTIEYCGIENTAITTIHLPSTVTTLAEKAFNNDSGTPGINTITGGENVQSIGWGAFASNQISDYSMFKNATIASGAFTNQTLPLVTGSYGASTTIIKSNESMISASGNIQSINKGNLTELILLNVGSGSDRVATADGIWDATVPYNLMAPTKLSINLKETTLVQGEKLAITNDNLGDYVESITIDDKTFSYDEVLQLDGSFTIGDTSKIDTNVIGEQALPIQVSLPNDVTISGALKINIVASQSTINVKDTTIYQGIDQWKAQDNFVSATNTYGEPVSFSEMKIDGTVTMDELGVQKIVYSFVDSTGKIIKKAATVTVVKNQQSITASNYTMKLGGTRPTTKDFSATATDKLGHEIEVIPNFDKVDFDKIGTYEVSLETADGQFKIVQLTIEENNQAGKTDPNQANNTTGDSSNSTEKGKNTVTTSSKASLPKTNEKNSWGITAVGVLLLLVVEKIFRKKRMEQG